MSRDIKRARTPNQKIMYFVEVNLKYNENSRIYYLISNIVPIKEVLLFMYPHVTKNLTPVNTRTPSPSPAQYPIQPAQ